MATKHQRTEREHEDTISRLASAKSGGEHLSDVDMRALRMAKKGVWPENLPGGRRTHDRLMKLGYLREEGAGALGSAPKSHTTDRGMKALIQHVKGTVPPPPADPNIGKVFDYRGIIQVPIEKNKNGSYKMLQIDPSFSLKPKIKNEQLSGKEVPSSELDDAYKEALMDHPKTPKGLFKSKAPAPEKPVSSGGPGPAGQQAMKQPVQSGQKPQPSRGLKRGKKGGMYYETKSGRKVYVK